MMKSEISLKYTAKKSESSTDRKKEKFGIKDSVSFEIVNPQVKKGK